MKNFLNSEHSVSISPVTIIFAVFFILGLYFLFQISGVLILLLLAFIIMVALNPVVKFFNRKAGLPKVPSILLAYISLVVLIALFFALFLPPLASEAIQLINTFDLPLVEEQLKDFNFNLQELSSVIGSVGSSFNVILAIINSTFSGVFTVFTLMVMSFYLMLERPKLHKKISWFTSNKKHLKQAEDFIDSTEDQLGGWVRAQSILMFSIFMIIYISLSLISVPYALPLALIAGLLEIVPNLGPTIAMIPAVIITYLTFGPVMAGIVLLLYIIVQQLENNILVPKVMKVSANVNPLISITAILMGLKVGGVIGALLAIPVYIIARNIYSTFIKPSL